MFTSSFRNLDLGHELDRAGQGYVNMEGTCKCGNDASGSIKCSEFLDWLETVELFKMNNAP
jgi:hypothetical protein